MPQSDDDRVIDDHDDRPEADDHDEYPPDHPETDAFAAPSETAFWHTYSPRFECPISYVAAALIIALGLFFVSVMVYWDLQSDEHKPGPKIGMVDGDDAFGDGETGAGDPDAKVDGNNTPTEQDIKDILPDLKDLPEVTDQITKEINLDNPDSLIPVPADKAAARAAVEANVRKKLNEAIGSKRGEGGPGNGGVGGNPNGAGTGTGSDSTAARTMRWVIAFKTGGGRDYLAQLQGLGAKVMVPTADGKSIFFENLSGDPPTGREMTDADWKSVSGLVQFNDFTNTSRRQVGDALGLGMLPKGFYAFFPKALEQELARKETGYQQRRSEDIDETKFEVVNRGGKPELVVTRQTLKR